MLARVAVLVMLLAGWRAEAQAQEPTHPADGKSPAFGSTLAGVSTLGPVVAGLPLLVHGHASLGAALIAAGICLGPSLGHFYAGEWGNGFTRLVRRSLIFGGAALVSWLGVGSLGMAGSTGGGGEASLALLFTGVGIATVAFGFAIYDLSDSGEASRRANRRRDLRAVTLAPLVGLRSGSPSGVVLAATF